VRVSGFLIQKVMGFESKELRFMRGGGGGERLILSNKLQKKKESSVWCLFILQPEKILVWGGGGGGINDWGHWRNLFDRVSQGLG